VFALNDPKEHVSILMIIEMMCHTFSCLCNLVRHILKVPRILLQVCLQPGMLTPSGAHAAMSIISQNFGWDSISIGFGKKAIQINTKEEMA
jgi:hypothetical protein